MLLLLEAGSIQLVQSILDVKLYEYKYVLLLYQAVYSSTTAADYS